MTPKDNTQEVLNQAYPNSKTVVAGTSTERQLLRLAPIAEQFADIPETFTASDGQVWKLMDPTWKKTYCAFPDEEKAKTRKTADGRMKTTDEARAAYKANPPAPVVAAPIVHVRQPINIDTVRKEVERMSNRPPKTEADKEEQAETVREEGVQKDDQIKPFPNTVFENLPEQLKVPCMGLVSATEREVFLVGALGVVSGMLPNVMGIYDGKTVYPHLYTYVLAPYGTGKGALTFAGQLMAEMQQRLEETCLRHKEEHEGEVARYEKEMAAFKKSKDANAEPPTKPQEPKNETLAIPANTSKTGFMQLLDENNQRGILFETEADTLGDALAQDYGNFSDGLRKGFHHETISYFRRTNNEWVRMKSPRLSVVLSSTDDQLAKLIPSAANGLFSRFLYYNAPPDPTFRNVFDKRKRNYEAIFEQAGSTFCKIYLQLEARAVPVEVNLTEQQEAYFFAHFSAVKESIYNDYDEQLGGTVNRLGLITFRLCMIFTVLQAFADGIDIPDVLTCSEEDFHTCIEIVKTLTAHALLVYEKLPKPRQFGASTKFENMRADKEGGMSWTQIAAKYGYKDKQGAQAWYDRQMKRLQKLPSINVNIDER